MTSENTPLNTFAANFLTEENAKAAGTFAKDKFEELRKQASDGDYSIRLFALIGGFMLVVLSITEFLGKVLFLNFIGALLDVYTFLLGLVVLILEGQGQIPFFPKALAFTIQKYALILKYVWGRGALYFVAGTLQISQMGLFDWIAGGFMTFVGVVYIIVGKKAQGKLRELKNSSISETTLKNKFQQADYNGSGRLDMTSFHSLALSLGLDFNRREMEAAFLVLDKDADGEISFVEFEAWWNALDEPGLFQLV